MATVRIQVRRGTASQWSATNPVLAAGEVGLETDTRKIKFGDGNSTWTSLNYLNPGDIEEISQDAVNSALTMGTGLTKVYNDAANTITLAVDTSVIATKAELAEVSQDSVNDAIVAGTGLDKVYDDASNTITLDIDSTVTTNSGSQTLTNKTISLGNNTVSGTLAQFNTAVTDADLASLAGSETLTNKTLNLSSNTLSGTTAEFNTALSDNNFATQAGSETLTNKTISLASNTISGTVAEFNTALSDGNFATIAGTETLTNKTLTSPTVSGLYLSDGSFVIEGTDNDHETTISADPTADRTITLPDATGTVVLRDSTDTLTNKTINLTSNTLSGTTAQFNTALSDGDFATLAGTETLTNKTLGSTTFTGAISGTSLTLSGDLTVNGTTTTLNSTTLSVDDKNITLADTASPSDAAADGGGITLKGTTDKTFNWSDTTDSWTSSENIDLASGKSIKINNTDVLTSSAVLGKSLPSGTVVGTTDSQTLTNKTLNLSSNTLSGTTAQFNSALSDDNFATLAGTETLTNKTLTLPTVGGTGATFSGSTSGSTVLKASEAAGTTTVTLPATTGTVVTTGDTGTVTSNMIADGTIVNADINSSAAIDKTKISGTAITAADTGTVTSTMIADGTIVNADISATAAIAATKISGTAVTQADTGTVTSTMIADGTIVNADINASAAIALSKLATDPLARANHTGTQTASTISNFDTQVRTSKVTDLAAPTGSFSMNSQKITNLATPTASTDAANKAYVDAAVEGLHVHESVKAATTANITLATDVENGDTLDGVTLATGDRILVKNQTTKAENGIYVVAASGAPTRATDFDTAAEVDSGDFVFVDQGTTYANTGWVQINTPATIGTDAIEFVQFSGAGTFTAGTGLTLTGTVFSINTGTTADLSTAQTLTNKTIALGSNTVNGTLAQFNSAVTDADLVSLNGAESLTNKTIAFGSNTISGTLAEFNTAVTDANLVSIAGTETLTNKTLTSPVISTISNTGTLTLPTSTDTLVGRATTDTLTNKTLTSPVISTISNTGTLTLPTSTDTLIGRSTTDTLTNKTIALDSNTVSGTIAQFNSAVTDADLATIAGTETLTNKTLTAPKFADLGFIADANGNELIILDTTSSAVNEITLANAATGNAPTLTASGGDTNISLNLIAKGSGQIQAGGVPVVTTTGTQTLTNKTLTSPVISSISNTGTITLPTSTDTLVGKATTDTLTNKTINLTSNTLSGTVAQFNTALSDGDFATLAGTETLTNKTLGATTFTGTISGTSLTLSGDLTVNGTTTNINTTNLVVEDKNVIIGDVATPTDTTADGGGITLKGATDKTLNWVNSTAAWTSSEDFNLASGKVYEINGTTVLSATEVLGKAVPSGLIVGTTDSQTLTNKTLTSPIISSISNTGTLTLPTSTDTLVGRATTDTLTNKSISLGSNTVTGTIAQFNTAVTDADLATLAGTETLTNKTINLSSNTLTATSAQIASSVTDETGSGALVFGTNPTITPAAGTTSTAANGAGYMGMPQNSKSASYTLAATDAGKHIYVTATGQTITIPANSAVALPIGTTVVVINGNGVSTTIAINTDTLRQANTSSTGSRTLASNGMCTLVKINSTEWIIGGNGVS